MTLRPRDKGLTLPTASEPAITTEVPVDDHDIWRESTLELERGLDVVELPIEVVLPEPQTPKTP